MNKTKRDDEFFNVFNHLKERKSMLLNLFDTKSKEIFELGCQAPSPSKDYCQLVMTREMVIFRRWRITLRGDSESRYPLEIKDTYEDFAYDDNLQKDIARIFGINTLVYMKNIIEKGKIDYIVRLPEKIIIKIISNLELEDLSRLSQVNNLFRQLCRSDRVWMSLYRKHYSNEITKDLIKLAERDGWRKLFFTNKIKLKLELRRQAKDNDEFEGSVYHTPRRVESAMSKSKPKQRNSQSAAKKSYDVSRNIAHSDNRHNSTFFLTEK